MDHQQFGNVQTLFTRCLRDVPYMGLWRLYLDYIRRVNSESAGVPAATAQKTVTDAFEFVLQHVGQDPDVSGVWQEYCAFIKSWNASNPVEEGRRIDALRRAYHRAVVLPMNNVEALWRDYDAFENSLNKFMVPLMLL